MLRCSLFRGQIIDTGTNEQMRRMAEQELTAHPYKREQHTWTRKAYRWAQYDMTSNEPMKLAALVYLFTGLTIQSEFEAVGHSSYVDSVSTLGLAYMIAAADGGYLRSDRTQVGEPEHPYLWDSLPMNGNDSGERQRTLDLVARWSHETRLTDIARAHKVWDALMERVRRIRGRR